MLKCYFIRNLRKGVFYEKENFMFAFGFAGTKLIFPHVTWASDTNYCVAEGDGSNVTWALDESDTLTISGSGKMEDFNYEKATPWYGHRINIKSVTIELGVTSIGKYAFYNCSSLTSVTFPDKVTYIGDYAFYNCSSLNFGYLS